MSYNPKSHKKLFTAAISATMITGTFVSLAPLAANANEVKSFADVKPNDYFYNAITSLTSRNIIKGYEDGTYRPYESVTRAQAAKIVALSLGLDTTNVKNPGFKDANLTDWYYGPVAALVNAGIMSGYGDQFKPNEPLTRAQMAKIISLGYKLEQGELSNNPFKDVKSTDWFAQYLPGLISSEITTGKTPDTFAPNLEVTRGQIAAFVYRSEVAVNPVSVESKIVNITNTTLELSSGTYSLNEDLKKWLNPSNLTVLKGANVKISLKDSNIVGIESLEITASGTSSEDSSNPLKNHVVFDGKGATLSGDLTVNGDFVTVKNLTIKGDLEIGSGVKNSFYSDNISVEGNTSVSDSAVATVNESSGYFYKSLAYKVSAENLKAAKIQASSPVIIFANANMNSIEVSKNGVVIESKGSTKVTEFNISSNIVLKADEGVVIPKVTVKEGASQVTIDASVTDLAVATKEALTVNGKGDIKNLKIESGKEVKLETEGKIEKLETTSKDSKISIGENTKVVDLVVPEGSSAEDIIEDYEQVKENIEKVGGEVVTTPAPAPAPAPSPVPAPVPSVPTPPVDTTPPTVTIATNTSVNISETVDIQSSEAGVAYLIPSSENPTSNDELDRLLNDGVARYAVVSEANTDIHIPTTGLTAGDYKVIVIDSAHNLSQPQSITLNDVSAPLIIRVHAIDNDFNNVFSKYDQINITFDEELATESKAAVLSELEQMTNLFGNGVSVQWIEQDPKTIAVTIMTDVDSSIDLGDSLILSRENVYDVSNNKYDTNVTFTVPSKFKLTGGVIIPGGLSTTTLLKVRFAGELHEDTKLLTEVSELIDNSRVSKLSGGITTSLEVSNVEWNVEKTELLLTIPETSFVNGDIVDVPFVNDAVKDKNYNNATLGGIEGHISLSEIPAPTDTEAPQLGQVTVDGPEGVEAPNFETGTTATLNLTKSQLTAVTGGSVVVDDVNLDTSEVRATIKKGTQTLVTKDLTYVADGSKYVLNLADVTSFLQNAEVGTYTIEATFKDTKNNSQSYTLTVVVSADDTEAPQLGQVTVDGPEGVEAPNFETGTTATLNLTKSQLAAVTGGSVVVADANLDTSEVRATIKKDAQTLVTKDLTYVADGSKYVLNLADVTSFLQNAEVGTYTIEATFKDTKNNSQSYTLTVVVSADDTEAPQLGQVTVDGPEGVEAPNFETGTTATLNLTKSQLTAVTGGSVVVDDVNLDTSEVRATIKKGTQTLVTKDLTYVADGSKYVLNLADVTSFLQNAEVGTYTIEATFKDTKNNSQSYTLTVVVSADDTEAPQLGQVTVDGPEGVEAPNFETGTTATLNLTKSQLTAVTGGSVVVDDVNLDTSEVRATIKKGTQTLVTKDLTYVADGSKYVLNLADVTSFLQNAEVGTYTIEATFKDTKNNSQSYTLTVVVSADDTEAPQLGQVTVDGPEGVEAPNFETGTTATLNLTKSQLAAVTGGSVVVDDVNLDTSEVRATIKKGTQTLVTKDLTYVADGSKYVLNLADVTSFLQTAEIGTYTIEATFKDTKNNSQLYTLTVDITS
ncbi:S-layer homology domain-containing protein [Bacillus sp. AK128]